MKKLIVSGCMLLASCLSYAQNTGLNPSSLKLAVYKFSVSTSELCTDLVTVVDNGNSPQEVNFIGGVNLGTGTISSGTYPCVVVEFADHIKFTPDSNSTAGNCSTVTEETMDVCSANMGATSTLPDGTVTTCTNGSDRVAMYLSTTSVGGNGVDAFNPPTTTNDAVRGFNLAEALEVAGAAAGKLVVNAAGKVCDGDDGTCDGGGQNGQCRLEPPAFSFSQVE